MKSVLAIAASSACLIASVAAGNDASRAFAMERLSEIEDRTYNLSRAIGKWDGTLQDALTNIHNPAEAIANFVTESTTQLKNYNTTYDITQAFRIGGSTQDLAYAVNASIAALNAQQARFKKALADSIVVADTQKLLNASEAFSNLLVSYVPANLAPVALALKSQVIDSLKMGISCFQGNSTNSTGPVNPNCNAAVADAERTHKLALAYGAIRNDGTPIA